MLAWEPVIGLEVHVQLATRSKLFCRCENRFGAPPNSLVCPVCLGYPGALPVANGAAIELAATLALALGCDLHPSSEFARKNYFYPDLPKGYQISQFDRPLATGGEIPIPSREPPVRIHRLHLEEDAGKLLHEAPGGAALDDVSLVDFNRCGVPLVEIVTEPDLRSAGEAEEVLRALRQLLQYTGTSDGNMEEGSLRCDANVSLRPAGATDLGVKVEIKNLNSFRHVVRAVEHEIERQRELLDAGGEVFGETRGYDDASGTTYGQRGKEEAHDYRYLPDPDLPLIVLSTERLGALRAQLVETPWQRQRRFQEDLGLSAEDAAALTASRGLADYFESILAQSSGLAMRPVANWVRNETLRELKERDSSFEQAPTAARVAELLRLVEDGTLSLVGAREVQSAIWDSEESPEEAARRLGRIQVHDDDALGAWVDEVIAAFPSQVAEFRAGKSQVLGFLTGQIMRRSAGRADARRSQELLRERLAAGAARE